jgi:hypothetical protein
LSFYDCDLECVSSSFDFAIGDGECDDGGWPGNFNCVEFDFDGGDCESVESCPDGEFPDCDESCWEDWYDGYLGDGSCDDGAYGPDLDCALFSYDDGDCADTPEPTTCDLSDLGTSVGDVVASGSTAGATDDWDSGCGGGGLDMAFSWTPLYTRSYRFSTDGSDFDTVIAIYGDDCLTFLECNDDDPDSWSTTSAVDREMTAGTTYIIVIDGYSSTEWGDFVLNINPA